MSAVKSGPCARKPVARNVRARCEAKSADAKVPDGLTDEQRAEMEKAMSDPEVRAPAPYLASPVTLAISVQCVGLDTTTPNTHSHVSGVLYGRDLQSKRRFRCVANAAYQRVSCGRAYPAKATG